MTGVNAERVDEGLEIIFDRALTVLLTVCPRRHGGAELLLVSAHLLYYTIKPFLHCLCCIII